MSPLKSEYEKNIYFFSVTRRQKLRRPKTRKAIDREPLVVFSQKIENNPAKSVQVNIFKEIKRRGMSQRVKKLILGCPMQKSFPPFTQKHSENSCTNIKLLIETLMEEIKPVVTWKD